jgi:hypothetical protein
MAVAGLLDAGGRPVRRQASPTQTIGVSGVQVYGGYIDPLESTAALRGTQRYKTFSEILANISIVAAGVRYFLNLLAKAGWKVEPASADPEAERIAELCDGILFSDMETPWHRVVRRAGMYRLYGFSVQEWTAISRDDGAIGFKDVAPRPQVTIEKWDVEEDGTVIGMVQVSPQTRREIYLPRAKVVYLVDDSISDNPEGLGLFRHMAEPARRLERYQKLEGFGFETDLRGIPVVRWPKAILQQQVNSGLLSQGNFASIESAMKKFVTNHIKSPETGMLLDSMTYQTQDESSTPSNTYHYGVELLKAGSTSQPQVAETIERITREIARIIGVEHLLLGGDGTGSLAMSRDKSDNFALIVDGSLLEIRESFEVDLLRPLFALNGWPREYMPTLKTDPIKHRALEEITDALERMARAGAVLDPDDPAVGEVRDIMGLSRPASLDAEDAVLPQGMHPEPEPDDMPERVADQEE